MANTPPTQTNSDMKIAVFSSKAYDADFLKEANEKLKTPFQFLHLPVLLNETTVELAHGCEAVCLFVNDVGSSEILSTLSKNGTKLILLRCAGFNNVDLAAAKALGLKVYRVPAYSPYAVAEHAVALLLCLNRKIHKAFNRVREQNFALSGLLGFDVRGKTVGVLGTGKIGQIFTQIMHGFGCKLIAYDVYPCEDLTKNFGLKYVTLDELLKESDIISIHVPLLKETTHMINDSAVAKMKDGVFIINTSRGAIVDSKAVIGGLKSSKIGGLAMDVYEGESELFFQDLSNAVIKDDVFTRLLSFPNVIITGHQAFFTREAQQNICATTLQNAEEFQQGKDTNELTKTVKQESKQETK